MSKFGKPQDENENQRLARVKKLHVLAEQMKVRKKFKDNQILQDFPDFFTQKQDKQKIKNSYENNQTCFDYMSSTAASTNAPEFHKKRKLKHSNNLSKRKTVSTKYV